jgi:MFS transporter, YQGE family, putative transporter
LFAIFYLAVLVAREDVLTYYPLFAIFFGIANGVYWIGYWVLFYEVADDRNRLRFIGLQSVVMTTSNLSAPLLAGAIFVFAAGMTGYLVLFGLSFVFFLAATMVSLLLRHAGGRRKSYYLSHMGLVMRKNSAYRKVTYGHLLYGLKQGILLLLPPILLYQVLQGENLVGFFNAFASLLSVIASYLFSRFARERHIKKYLFFGSLVTTFGAVTLFFGLSVTTVAFFMIAITMLNPLIQSSFDGYYYKLIGRLPLRGEMRVEALVVRELCWNVGRSITIFALIMLAEDLNGIWLTVIVALTMAVPMLLLFLIEDQPGNETERKTV